jgi:Zn-dependent protease with chaperone function
VSNPQRTLLTAFILLAAFAAAARAATPADAPTLSGERAEQARAYFRWTYALYAVRQGYDLLVVGLILFTGCAAKLRDAARRVTRRAILGPFVYVALFGAILTALDLPLMILRGFWLEHHFHLSNLTFPGWLWEVAKGELVSLATTGPVVGLLYAALGRWPRTWWVWTGAAALPVIVFFVVIAPVVIDPLFNKFEPLPDGPPRARILALGERAGIDGARVFRVDKSKQTKKLNAYVTGLLGTKRIVLWDTLLEAMEPDEIDSVMAHEMGHYIRHDVWQGALMAWGVVVLGLGLAAWGLPRLIRRWAHRLRFSELPDPASIPLLGLAFAVFLFLMMPVTNGFSRHIERRADLFSLELTRDRDAAVRSFRKLAAGNLSLPNPPEWIEFWFYSHPSLDRRIALARTWPLEGK